MKYRWYFGITAFVICNVLLCAQTSRQNEQKQEPPAAAPTAPQSPSTDGQAPPSNPSRESTPPVHALKVCSDKNPPPCFIPPHAVFTPDPEYSEEARNAHHEGTCVLWLVVGTDGKVHNLKVVRRLGLGLDEKAMEAVNRWVFQPGTKDGKPVAVQINVEMSFHLPLVLISPASALVTAGAQQQFSATITGASNSAVRWSIDGSDCAASACGTISAEGLYTAPSTVPSFAVSVTATSTTDPHNWGSAAVSIKPKASQ